MRKIKKYIALFIINHFLCGNHFFSLKRVLLRFSNARIGKGVKVFGPISFSCNLSIGNNSWIGKNFTIHGNGTVQIGENCDIAPDVAVLTGSHEIGTSYRRAGTGKRLTVQIGNGCWIGARSTILGNVKINDGCIVGCCSFVNKELESNTLNVGVPAKTIKHLSKS